MRILSLLTLLPLLFAGCGSDVPPGTRSGAADSLSASVGESVPPPEPGELEDLRSRSDPAEAEALPDEGVRRDSPPGTRALDTVGVDGAAGVASADTGAGGAEGVGVAPEEGEARGGSARFPRPEQVRGIYLNAWTAGSRARRTRLVDMARRTELNTFVIDIKDASGHISHDSRLPVAREVGATKEIRIRDLPALLNQLDEAGIYPIARIVVAKDPILAEGRPDLAIQDSAGGPWLDQNGVKWLNLHDRQVWDYHVELAREVVEAGFPEIQWDYVRFPDAPEAFLSRAVFPGQDGRTKAQAIREFLGYARGVLGAEGVQVTADVFGVTTSYQKDVGIGQLWESFIDQVDVALPMVYPSHYWPGSFGFEEPNAYPYEIVRRALRDAMRRSARVEGAGLTRPWLQDFTLGDPPYGSPEVRAQIQATYDAGIREWILWNPGSRYTEAALIPARGLPSWLEPVIRVGGKVVAVSKRYEVLGEDPPPESEELSRPPVLEDPAVHDPASLQKGRSLPPVPLPDTVRGVRGSPQAPGRTGARGGGHRDLLRPEAPGGSPSP